MDLENKTETADAPEELAGSGGEPDYYTIGEMARAFSVSLRALRFYEDRGLIHPLRRGQMRLYSPRVRLRLQMVLRGKQLGFTLIEIREMLAEVGDSAPEFELALAPDQILAQIGMLQRQREGIEKAIDALKVTQQRLSQGKFVPESEENHESLARAG